MDEGLAQVAGIDLSLVTILKLLLDTQCLIWWFTEPERLNLQAIDQIVSEDNEFGIAAVPKSNLDRLHRL